MSKPTAFRKTFGNSPEVQQLQSSIEAAISSVIRNPLLNGRLIEGLELTSGTNKIEHKLARSVRGFIPVMRSNAATIYQTANDDRFLTVTASANVTVSLWIF